MPHHYLLDLDRLGASRSLLLTFLGIGLLAGLLYMSGVIGWIVGWVGLAIRGVVRSGFWLWQQLLSWANWPTFLGLVAVTLAIGITGSHVFPPLALACGVILLVLGAATCLTYVSIDLERYEVARGYKAIHDPMPGQALAVHLVRHGHQVGLPLLAAAAFGVVGGFALLNQGLYQTVGPSWYRLGESGLEPEYADFLAYTLINLLGVVDLLHLASSYNYVHATYVRQAQWPAATLLTLFKTFFTMVLLQQIFASVRRGRLLSETIADFWSPHPPIQERARGALPQFGPGVVWPLLGSLRSVPALTPEQREYLPRIIADVGPAAIPILFLHLHDPAENVRAVAVAALGCLHALDGVPEMIELLHDPDEWVRQATVQALGLVAGQDGKAARRRRTLLRALRSPRSWLHRSFRRHALPTPTADPVLLSVWALRSALKDSSAGVRVGAVRSLGQLGPAATAAVEDLVHLLGDEEEVVRCQAAEALQHMGSVSAEAIPVLVGLLQERGTAVRVAAAGALGAMKKKAEEAVGALVPLLCDSDEAVRAAAASAVSQIGTLSDEAMRDLTRGLESKDTLVRAQTAEALGAAGAAAAPAAPALAEALEDNNDRVRAKAAQALGQMGEAAAPAVRQLVRALADEDTWVSALAAEALGEIGECGARAVPALIRSLRHANSQVRANAAGALGKLGSAAAAAAPALARAARDPHDEVRLNAVAALGAVGSTDAVAAEALLSALEDTNAGVRATAVASLAGREDLKEQATSALFRAMEDESDEVKIQAVRALPRVAGTTSATVDALCQLLHESSSEVQIETAQALGKFGPVAARAGVELLRMTQTGVESLRETALRALVLIQPAEAAMAFLAGLKDARSEIRILASAGLIKAPDVPPDAVAPLIGALNDPEGQVRANAARVLSRLDPLPAEAVIPLTTCATDPDDGVRLNAALALRRAAANQALPAFHQWLTDPDPRVRVLAVGFILQAVPADPEASVTLRSLLDDPTQRIRRSAVELLRSLGDHGKVFRDDLRRRATVEVDPELTGLLDEMIEPLGSGEEEAVVSQPAEKDAEKELV